MLHSFAVGRRSIVATTLRTGPLGRVARLVLAMIFAASLWSIVGPEGSARFRNAHILTEPSAWLLHALMAVIFVLFVGALAQTLVGPRSVRGAQFMAAAAFGVRL